MKILPNVFTIHNISIGSIDYLYKPWVADPVRWKRINTLARPFIQKT